MDSFLIRLLVSLACISFGNCHMDMAQVRRKGGNMETSSTLAWVESHKGQATPLHGIRLSDNYPSTVWCRAQQHGTHMSGALKNGRCVVPFLNNALTLKDKFQVLVSVNGSARVRYVKWDRYFAPPQNSVAVYDSSRLLAGQVPANGAPQAGFLVPRERRVILVAGEDKVERVDAAMVLVEDEPGSYDLRAISLDAAKTEVQQDEVTLAEATLLNPGPSPQRVVEEVTMAVKQSAYWGLVKGTLIGLPAHVVWPLPQTEERDLTWGIQNELDREYIHLLEYELPPGAGVKVRVVGTKRTVEAPYSGTITATYEDGARQSRVIEGLHIDERLILLTAIYETPYFINNGTEVPGAEEITALLYKSTTTTTTTTTTTSTTTTTPSPEESPLVSQIGPAKPVSDSLSTMSESEEVQYSLAHDSAVGTHRQAGISLLVISFIIALCH